MPLFLPMKNYNSKRFFYTRFQHEIEFHSHFAIREHENTPEPVLPSFKNTMEKISKIAINQKKLQNY